MSTTIQNDGLSQGNGFISISDLYEPIHTRDETHEVCVSSELQMNFCIMFFFLHIYAITFIVMKLIEAKIHQNYRYCAFNYIDSTSEEKITASRHASKLKPI